MATEAQLEKVRRNANQEAEAAVERVLAEESASDKERNGGPTNEELDRARNYRYPLNVSDNFPATIIFKVIQVDGTDLFEVSGIKKIYNEALEILGLADEEKETVADQNIDAKEKKRIITDSKAKPKELISYENNTGGDELGRITMPLQSRLTYADVANYDPNASLGIMGGLGEDAALGRNPFEGANSGGSLTGAASALVSQVLAKSAGALLGGAAALVPGKNIISKGATAGLGAAASGVLAAGSGPANAAASATRIASAPNYRTLFQNVSIRAPFVFDFKLVATSKEEAKEIKNIIKMFRQELYPEKITAGASGVPIAYKFPNLFEIEVRNRFGDNPGFKIQRCYLREVQTTFNENVGMFDDGEFISVTLSLSFVEIVALDKEKIRSGAY